MTFFDIWIKPSTLTKDGMDQNTQLWISRLLFSAIVGMTLFDMTFLEMDKDRLQIIQIKFVNSNKNGFILS